jgi:hypothetical protein
MLGYINSGYYEEFVQRHYPDEGNPSSQAPPPPPPPTYAPRGFDAMFGGESSSQATPPPPPPEEDSEAPLAALLSVDLFGYGPTPYGTSDASLATLSEITIPDSIYLTSPMHWLLKNSP